MRWGKVIPGLLQKLLTVRHTGTDWRPPVALKPMCDTLILVTDEIISWQKGGKRLERLEEQWSCALVDSLNNYMKLDVARLILASVVKHSTIPIEWAAVRGQVIIRGSWSKRGDGLLGDNNMWSWNATHGPWLARPLSPSERPAYPLTSNRILTDCNPITRTISLHYIYLSIQLGYTYY